ncbi:hypothetical protein PHYBOEH_009609 [Phytophthora boehmeriae]|uniref:Uncharacterized protein n=1 Tax=Phytophthora boehmeriae TaxID=109152 RepID=A0A8T1X5J5_9STRA|nr:hypothetical protein PHYBOEH_009609 [Phytophthora boehmeriae]
MDKRSLRRTGENRELSKAETANDEERAISWSTLGALVKRKEVTDGDLVRMLIQGEDLAKILKKMGVKYKTVNGIKVYPKYDPEYQRFLQYFRFIDSVPGLKRN